LATQISGKGIRWSKADTGSRIGKWIDFEGRDGGQYHWFVDKNGVMDNVAGTHGRGNTALQGKKLDEVLGKGLADKIMAKESGTLAGEGLKFGGEWANNLYDKQVKNIVEDLTGQKVEMLDMGLPIKSGAVEEWRWMNDGISGRTLAERKLKPEHLKVGLQVDNNHQKYIITDILGDGKFKAVRKSLIDDPKLYNADKLKSEIAKGDFSRIPNSSKETFDISQKTTKQMGIKLTPEVKAKIRGEALKIETSNKKYGGK